MFIQREARKALEIKPGESLRLTVEGDKMVLTKPVSPEEFLKKRRHKGGISAPVNRSPVVEEGLGSRLIYVNSNYCLLVRLALPRARGCARSRAGGGEGGILQSPLTLIEFAHYFRMLPKAQ